MSKQCHVLAFIQQALCQLYKQLGNVKDTHKMFVHNDNNLTNHYQLSKTVI